MPVMLFEISVLKFHNWTLQKWMLLASL